MVGNGKPVPAKILRDTILITDHNTFRFPKASGVGTDPAGRFTVDPDTTPKQVDSIAEGGPLAGQLTRGIYEIIDATHSALAGAQPAGRVRQNLSRHLAVDESCSPGTRSARCRRINQATRVSAPSVSIFHQKVCGKI